jgi:hypothetical protein
MFNKVKILLAFYDLAEKVVLKNGGISKSNSSETKLVTLDNDSNSSKKKKKPCTIL